MHTPRHFCSVSLAACIAIGAATAACSRDIAVEKQSHFEAANRYASEGKHDEALIEYRAALQADPHFGEAHYRLGQIYERKRDIQNALGEYVRAADLLPNETDVQLAAASLLSLAGRFEDAKVRLEAVLAGDPRNVKALTLLGSALAGLRDLEGAIREVEKATALDPLEPGSHAALGVLRMAHKETARAEEALSEAVRLAPTLVEPRIVLARLYWTLGRAAEAEEALAQAVAAAPNDPLANRAMAAFLVARSRAPEAERYLRAVANATADVGARFALADYYAGTKRWADARAVLEPLRADTAHGTESTLRLAAVAYSEGTAAEAHRLVDELIATNRATAEATLLKGRFLLAERQPAAAIEKLKESVALQPQSAPAQYVLANAYLARNDLRGALEAYRAASAADPSAWQPRLQLSHLLLLRGDTAGAVQAAQDAVQVQPDLPATRLALAEALVATGDVARVEQELNALKTMHAPAPAIKVLTGKLLTLKKQYPEARRVLEAARAADPTSLDAAFALVTVDLESHDAAAARRRVDLLVERAPDAPGLALLAGRVYMAANDPARAEDTLRRLLSADPSMTPAYEMLGELYLQRGALTDALAQFEELARREPRSATAQTMIGLTLEAQHRPEEAKRRYEQALELNSGSAVAANNLAWLLAESGENLERALSLARMAVEQQPEELNFHDTLGWVYYKKGEPSLAIPAFERAVNGENSNAQFHYHLGLAYAAAGDRTKARASLQQALTLIPTFEGATHARTVLQALGQQALD